jgi:hypothetical protein
MGARFGVEPSEPESPNMRDETSGNLNAIQTESALARVRGYWRPSFSVYFYWYAYFAGSNR